MKKTIALNVRVLGCMLAFAVSAILPLAVSGQSAALPQNQGFTTVGKILGEGCMACHEWAASYRGIADPSRIVASYPEKSLLYLQLSSDSMPPSGAKLSREDRALIRAWIAAGAPPTNTPLGKETEESPPYPRASENPSTQVPEPCPCGLE